MALDPSMQAAPSALAPDAPASAGFTVELKVDGQGKMTVCVEPAAEEAGEESSGAVMAGSDDESGDDESQPVANIGEALKLIREIVTHGGQMADVGASSDEMSSGYGSGE